VPSHGSSQTASGASLAFKSLNEYAAGNCIPPFAADPNIACRLSAPALLRRNTRLYMVVRVVPELKLCASAVTLVLPYAYGGRLLLLSDSEHSAEYSEMKP
jgi:hypothetical protein